MRAEPERMLRNHNESLIKLQMTSRTFQRVKVPLRESSEGIQCSMKFLEPAQVEVVSFEHWFPLKEISLKLSKPWNSNWFVALHSSTP